LPRVPSRNQAVITPRIAIDARIETARRNLRQAFFVVVGKRVGSDRLGFHVADNNAQEAFMSELPDNQLPATFNRLAWSNLAAQSAEQIALAAAPIVAVLLLGVGEGQTGLLQTALTLPFVLFAIPAGWLADRFSRRWLMTGSEALRAVALLAVLLLISLDWLTLPLLALLGFVAVCGTVAYSVAAPALVPSLVSPKLLATANARIELARTVAFAGGPALGGVLVGWVGAAPAFGFAAALSVMAVVLLSGIYEPAREPAPRRHPMQDIREGAVFVLHHPLLRPVFVTQFVFGAGWFVILAVFVPYAVRQFGVSASGIGAILAMYGVGMVVGALLATRVMKRLQFGTVIALGPVTGFVAATVVASTTVIASPWLAGLGFFLLGVGPILWVISTATLRQSVTPPRLLGRVSAINTLSYGARPVGAGLGALVGGLYGAEACLYLAVAIFAAQALVILLSPAVALTQQPEMVSEPGCPARGRA
jgi:predicted MFS family arabinose efflux permease